MIREPDPVLGHAANFLYMLAGQRPNATAIRAFDMALTLTDIYSAVVAAIGTLKGPPHCGANAEVMTLLLDIRESVERRAR